jgi:hypothetical protein
MFHWICPECGREIAPTVRECAVCDPVAATVEIALAGEVEAPARATNETAAGRIRPEVRSTSVAAAEAIPAIAKDLKPLLALAGRIGAVRPPEERAGPVPPPALGLLHIAESDGTETLLPQFGVPAAGDDPLDRLTAMLESIEPEPPLSREIIRLAMPAIPPALQALIAELGPAELRLAATDARSPQSPPQRKQAAAEPPRLTVPTPLALGLPRRQASEQHLGGSLLALPSSLTEAIRPHTPAIDLEPPLAPLGKYSPLAGRPLRPAIPDKQVLKKETAPRTTLPGPMLTRRLVKFRDRELNPILPVMFRVKKPLIPGWMATALIIGTLLGAGFTGIISVVRPSTDAKPGVVRETEMPAVAGQSDIDGLPLAKDGLPLAKDSLPLAKDSLPVTKGGSPLAKSIEVTGFRIQTSTKKPEIQYLVVNHTPSRLNGVTVYVTLYAADAKAGQPPLCRFQFAAPNLAPFQSKEMSSAIEQAPRQLTLPAWDDLRAAVDIGQ